MPQLWVGYVECIQIVFMSPRTPRSYDEIVRHTVLDPDTSRRPDPPPTDDELRIDRRMRDIIRDALIAEGIDTLGIEVDRGRVILRGWVRDRAASSRVERVVAAAAPDAVVDNRMRIGES